MIGFRRAQRAENFTLMESTPAWLLIVVLFVGGDWVGAAADEATARRELHSRALTIAMEQTSAALEADFVELRPTVGYVQSPFAVIQALASDVDIAAAADDQDLEQFEYDVELRITELDARGQLRRVEVRVGYDRADGERAWVEMATVRQNDFTSHATAQRPSRRSATTRHARVPS